MAIIDLPHQDIIERTSGVKAVGFETSIINYSSKISQRAFIGASQEASRDEVWMVRWKQAEYLTPAEVVELGRASQYDTLKDFYEGNYLGKVRWKPFELVNTRIWEIVPNSWKQTNPAGSLFDVRFELKHLYVE